jgi:hypothetical protein
LLQNDFAHLGAQDRFNIRRQCAMLIQKPCGSIRLFQISIPQFRRGDFCNKIGTSATSQGDPSMSALEGESRRRADFVRGPSLTLSRHEAGRNPAVQQSAVAV